MFAALMPRKQSEELALPPSCTVEEINKTQIASTPPASSAFSGMSSGAAGASGASGVATGAPMSQL